MTQQGDRYDYEPGAIIPGHVYRVVQPLGQGGMGTVYLVEDTTIGKHYALKTINREFADRIDMAARMRKEARALVSLRHPNIVDVITLGQILRGDQRKGRLELRHVLDIAIDVSDALEKAHAEGFVHRDIKPDNIFLVVALEGTRAKAVVLDFGIIGLHDKEAAEDRGQFMGTPRYGAPEQVRGDCRPRAVPGREGPRQPRRRAPEPPRAATLEVRARREPGSRQSPLCGSAEGAFGPRHRRQGERKAGAPYGDKPGQ